jgi:uncharacterized protein (DUF362 family)
MASIGQTAEPPVRGGNAIPDKRLFIDRLNDDYDAAMLRGFEFLGSSGRITSQDRVVIKPNLTFPEFRRGVTTNPEAVEAVVRHVKNYTSKITVCEADSGGYNPFSMSAAFRSMGLEAAMQKYGVRLVNLSEQESCRVALNVGLRRIQVPVPKLLLEKTDLFITVPVPKVHMNTIISVAVKNQWGTIPQPADRLRLHPYFKEVAYFLNSIYPRMIAVVDGRYGLTGSGPLLGEVAQLNWLLVGDDVFLTDSMVARILGFDPSRIPYLRWILEQRPREEASCNVDWRQFQQTKFYLKRALTDYPGLFAFRSRLLAYLAYASPVSEPLHRWLYKFRDPFY